MKKKPDENDGSLPRLVEHQINEHTIGGFILFYFNPKTGKPEQRMTFDSPAHALALQKYISDWSEILHTVNIENAVTAIQFGLDMMQEPPPDDDDENSAPKE